MNTQLSTNFTLAELTTTQVRGISNQPGPQETENLRRLATDCLQVIRDSLGPIHVNSGYRSPEVNAKVGGAKKSQHMQGLAADIFILNGKTMKENFASILKLNEDGDIQFDQLIAEYWHKGGGWIHVSVAPDGQEPRGSVLAIGEWTGGKYVDYDADLAPEV